jgi:hypothetical protein
MVIILTNLNSAEEKLKRIIQVNNVELNVVFICMYIIWWSFAGLKPVESKILGRFLPKARPTTAAVAAKPAVAAAAKADKVDKIQAGARVAELMVAALRV